MTKFANMPERSSCCGSLISERTRTRRVFGSTLAPIVVILPSNTRPGNALERDLHLLSDAKRRTVGLGDVRQHPHDVDVGDGIGSRRVARLHEQPRRRIARRDAAGDRARHDQRRVGAAIGDDAVDVGIGLAEQAHRVARRAQIAFGGLLIGRPPGRRRAAIPRASYRARAGAPDCAWSAPKRRPRRSGSTRPAADRGCRW